MRDMTNRNLNLQGYIEQRARDVVFGLLCAVKLRYTPAQIQELIDVVNAVLDKRRLPETWDRLLHALERAARSGVVIDDGVLLQAFTEAGMGDHAPELLLQASQRAIAPTKDRLQSLALAYVEALRWKEARAFAHNLLEAIDSLDLEKASHLLVFESLRLQQQMEAGRTPQLLPETPAQLLANTGEETPWIWRGIVPARHVVLLAGREKGRGGKSTLLFGLISHILQGKPFLGRATTPQRILYISEETRDGIRGKLLAFGLADSPDLLLLTREAFPGGTHGALRRFQRDIEQLVERYQVSLVVVDTLQSFAGFRGEGENRTGDIQAELAPVMSLSARGVGVIVVHHHNKAHGEPRGGTALTGAVDVIVNIGRKGGEHTQNRRVLEWEGRYGVGAMEYEFDPETFTYVSFGTPEQAESDAVQRQILALLSAGEPLTQRQIQAQLNAPQQRVSDALHRLLNLGEIRRVGRGGKGDPYRYLLAADFTDFTDLKGSGDGKIESELNSGDFTADFTAVPVKSESVSGSEDFTADFTALLVKSGHSEFKCDFTVNRPLINGKTVKSESAPLPDDPERSGAFALEPVPRRASRRSAYNSSAQGVLFS